jgi:uncharacterized membrane protein YphA (DoxX/SURF4 family)
MKNKILLVVTILFGLMMVNAGLNKFFNHMPMPEVSPEVMTVLMALMTAKWILPLVGIAEIVGGVLIAIPRYRALGAIIIFPVTIGILVHHLTHHMAGVGMGLVLLIVNVWIMVEDKEKFMPMLK